MTEVPHLFVVADVEIDGATTTGISADGLPPKWFTKNPDTTFEEDDLPQMLRVIRHAADKSVETGCHESFYSWWRDVYDAQSDWALSNGIPPLLSGLGVSLCERAVLNAFCCAKGLPVHRVLRDNLLSIDLAALRSDLAGTTPQNVLPDVPLDRIRARHTVGLGDPLTEADVNPDERPNDYLPFTLEENINDYGLTHLKIKLSGSLEADHHRLKVLAELLNGHVGESARFTLDGNENYPDFATFQTHWEYHRESDELRTFFDQNLLFVEQPLHRDHALIDEVHAELAAWEHAPAIIIDESDADFSSLPKALSLGYSGTSHKNCKGIIKGVANAATVIQQSQNGRTAILSAEDLGNVGPVALLQDLAIVAALGISHVERNGHHYFAGLSMYPSSEQARIKRHHSDLYDTDGEYPCLRIENGYLQLQSVNAAPFGLTEHPDVRLLDEWSF